MFRISSIAKFNYNMGVLPLVLCCFLQLMSYGLSRPDNIEYVDPEYLDKLLEEERYEEFCKLLQITNVELAHPVKGNDTRFTPVGLDHGDMLLRPWQEKTFKQNKYAVRTWPSREVPYIISKTSYAPSDIKEIQKAIDNWNENVSQIKFRKKNKPDRDYVYIYNGKGTYSNLGKEGGQQAISVMVPYDLDRGAIQHVMMHTIGFSHEHNRPDRDDYIRVLHENIPDAFKHIYDKRSPDDFNALTDYDYYSIMHFDPYLLSPKEHKPAFQVLKKNIDFNRIGQRVGLTPSDHLKIQRLYG